MRVEGAPSPAPESVPDRERFHQAAEAFEAMLVQSLVKSMREAQLEDGFFGQGTGASTYEAMFESKISEAYVDELIRAYDHFFYHYDETPLLIVNTAEIDFVESANDRKALLQRITGGAVRGIEYYHPVRKRRK